jgi:glucose/mannose-6-phosphate isomerase
MGGSALGGGVVSAILYGKRLPGLFEVNRDYEFRNPPGEDTLSILISYSGNTEETVSMWRALENGPGRVLGVAAGGKLASIYAQEPPSRDRAFVHIPPQCEGFQPRFSLYFTTAVLLEVLERFFWIPREVEPRELRESLRGRMSSLEEEGKEIARFLDGRIPVIYTSARFDEAVARIWKVKLNENVKVPALYGAMPEVNHNEMIGFHSGLSDKFAFLLLEDPWMPQGLSARYDLFEEMMGGAGYAIKRLPMHGASVTEAVFDSLLLADWVCFYLADRLKVDPVNIPLIQEFKARIGSRERKS